MLSNLKRLRNERIAYSALAGGGNSWDNAPVMNFEIAGQITAVETIAVGRRIRLLPLLRKRYGPGRWRKLKGTAPVRLDDGTIRLAEVHWFEAHGIGRRIMRIKRFLD